MQPSQPAGIKRKISGRISRSFKIDQFGAERVSDGLIKSRLIDEAAIDHRLRDRFAVQFASCRTSSACEACEHALLDEKIGDLSVFTFISSHLPSVIEITSSAEVRPRALCARHLRAGAHAEFARALAQATASSCDC